MWTIKETHLSGEVSVYDGDKYIARFPDEADAIRACVAVNSDWIKVKALSQAFIVIRAALEQSGIDDEDMEEQ